MKIPLLFKEMINSWRGNEKQKPLSAKEKWLLLMLSGILLAVIFFPGGKSKDSESLLAGEKTDRQNGNLFDYAGKGLGSDLEKATLSLPDNLDAEIYNLKQYEVYLSGQLEQILSQIDGAGQVQAWVTLAGSSEKILYQAEDSDTKSLQEEDSAGGSRLEKTESVKPEVVLDSMGNPYIVKTIQPQVEGVLVVAEGAGNSVIKKNITEAVEVLFGIDAHRIKVAKKKVEE